MQPSAKALILSMCCLALSSCAARREAVPLRPDLANPQRMACQGAPRTRPALPAEHEIDWQGVLAPADADATLKRAQDEHGAYVRSVRKRNGAVAAYIVAIENRLFVCANNAQWWRDYWAARPKGD